MSFQSCVRNVCEVKTYSSALILYILLFAALIYPFWFKGEVISPHRQAFELAETKTLPPTLLENTKFSDYTESYVPEIKGFLDEKKSGWVALWSKQNELGRPFYSSFGPVYFPNWILLSLTGNPERFLTLLSLGMCFLAGLFALLFLKELGLSPLPALIAGISFASLPHFMYWATFPMFIAPSCWSAGIFYGITFLSRKFSFFVGSVLAFCVYSLLIIAYPQSVILYFYVLTGYGFYLCFQKWKKEGLLSLSKYILVICCAVSFGLLLALPVLRDLLITGLEAERLKEGAEKFLVFTPKINGRFFLLNFWPEILGNPISETFPLDYNGEGISLYMLFFAALGMIATFRKTWGWSLSILIFFSFNCYPSLYFFCMKYLGAFLSAIRPSVPPLAIVILMAYGLEAFMKPLMLKKLSQFFIFFTIFCILLFGIALIFSLKNQVPIAWISFFVSFLVLLSFFFQMKKSLPLLLLGGLVISLAFVSFPLLLRRDSSEIIKTSPLVEAIRSSLPDETIYAVASPGFLKNGKSLLTPRMNQALNLPSVHTYNSLCPLRYKRFLKDLGGDILSFWCSNHHINPDYDSTVFWMSNIGLMLSPHLLTHPHLKLKTKVSGVYMYQVDSRMGKALQIVSSFPLATNGDLQIADPRQMETFKPHQILDQGDLVAYEITNPQPSLLLLSQKFHVDWKAKVRTKTGWQKAETVAVNGFFQGVFLPKGGEKVVLKFLPWVRFMWIGHVFWALVILAFLIQFAVNYFRPKKLRISRSCLLSSPFIVLM